MTFNGQMVCFFLLFISLPMKLSLNCVKTVTTYFRRLKINNWRDSEVFQYNQRFFFLGCCWDDDIENCHPFLKMIESIQSLEVTARTVKLERMDKDIATRMLSHLLCLSQWLVSSLLDIVEHKTKGNPLFYHNSCCAESGQADLSKPCTMVENG
jgi:predicted ATPase